MAIKGGVKGWAVGFLAYAALPCMALPAWADARGTAAAARLQVVKVTASFDGDSPLTKHGFGFITGERDGFLFIATANHVVRSDVDDSPAANAKVQFFSDQGVNVDAMILATHHRAPMDLAVIKVARPAGSLGVPLCDDSQMVGRDLPVTYVGRDGEWYVPTGDGILNSPAPNESFQVDVDFARTVAVKEGTSGGPLVSERGLVGMITQDSNSNVATALVMDGIKRAFDGWNLPWTAPLCPKPPPLVPEDGVELGLAVGYGVPSGTFDHPVGYPAPTVANHADRMVPFIIEGGYHLTRRITAGALFHYATAHLTSAGCTYVGDVNCTASQYRVGVFGRYRYPVGQRFNVWAGIGAGYEWFLSNGTYHYDFRGFEIARFEAGGEVRVSRRVAIGPFASLSFSRFLWGTDTKDDPNHPNGQDLTSGDDLRTWHQWLIFGIRAAVALGH